jgi:hypothetical protein
MQKSSYQQRQTITHIVEKWVLNVECLCYVYEIKHMKLGDIYIV